MRAFFLRKGIVMRLKNISTMINQALKDVTSLKKILKTLERIKRDKEIKINYVRTNY